MVRGRRGSSSSLSSFDVVGAEMEFDVLVVVEKEGGARCGCAA